MSTNFFNLYSFLIISANILETHISTYKLLTWPHYQVDKTEGNFLGMMMGTYHQSKYCGQGIKWKKSVCKRGQEYKWIDEYWAFPDSRVSTVSTASLSLISDLGLLLKISAVFSTLLDVVVEKQACCCCWEEKSLLLLLRGKTCCSDNGGA